jgi:hypothetical protein
MATTLNSSAKTIDQNETTVLLSGISIAEIPIAYGHKFDLGSFGKIGVGASFKVMQARVYGEEIAVNTLKNSNDMTKRVKDSKADSTNIGLDLGALWRYEDLKTIGPINVGIVAKNLNSPEFDGPKDSTGKAISKVKVEPQMRFGIGLEPFSWLSIAADLDLTKNKTVLAGRESQNIGGGLEAHMSWAALRLGIYQNIAESSDKPIITAGLSLGPNWLRLDIDAAMATETGRYDNKTYPREAKVEFGLSTMF